MRQSRRKNQKNYIIVVALLLIVGISIGYAAITTALNINGSLSIKSAKWDVKFTDVNVTEGSVTATKPATISDDKNTKVEYEIEFQQPGDFYEFTVKVKNAGTMDAVIQDVELSGAESYDYLKYIVNYADSGEEVNIGDELKHTEGENEKTIKVRVEYMDNVYAEDLPTMDEEATLTFSVTYKQANLE